MDTLRMTNYIIAVVFFVCYTYQFLYIPVPWLLAKRKAAWVKPEPKIKTGYLSRYAKLTTSASKGAVVTADCD